ncbi:MAG: hypothetical protein R3F59_17545, partial [Myxococcota bacterium]
REITEIRVGCDGGAPLRVALFDGPRLPEGPVWLTARAGQARLDPPSKTAQAEDRAEWQVGAATVTAEGEGGTGRTTVRVGGEALWDQAWDALRPGSLDGAWEPVGLVRGKGHRLLLLRWMSREGFHYQAVKLGPGPAEAVGPDVYLYWCAN